MHHGAAAESPPCFEHPFELFLARLRQRGCRVSLKGSDQARATCPTHADARPSLVVTRRGSLVLFKCFAGCRQHEVAQALGLRMADLFAHDVVRESPKRIVAEYDYFDGDGVHIAQKVRFEPKTFRWRHLDPRARGYRWGLNGTAPGLYRISDLAGAQRVFCVEGEKAVDFLLALGLEATCPPSGASRWDRLWSLDLVRAGCHEVIVLPDADRPGQKHADRVAADLDATGIPVKVVLLPGLSQGSDAFDWLQGARTPADLEHCASTASYWAPTAVEDARLQRRRELTRERVRLYRLRKRAAEHRYGDRNAVNVRTSDPRSEYLDQHDPMHPADPMERVEVVRRVTL
jgi:hypothetical protein